MSICLKDLDRDELLALMSEKSSFTEADILWARYEVAAGRAIAIGRQILTMQETVRVAMATYNDAKSPQGRAKARGEVKRTVEGIHRADRRQVRQRQLADQLHQQWTALVERK